MGSRRCIRAFNARYRHEGTKYDRGRYIHSYPEGIVLSPQQLSESLKKASKMVVGSLTYEDLGDLYSFLREAHRSLPKANCFVVYKYYSDPDPNSSWYGRRAEWIGCSTREQAEEFAAALESFYAKKSPHLRRDEFRAELGEIDIQYMVRPDLSALDYIRSIRS